MATQADVTKLHYELIRGLIQNGVSPSNTELANRLDVSNDEVEALLTALSDIHGVVLHPYAKKPWIVNPFSLTPTLHWLQGPQFGWWVPCIWCAFGAAALIGGKVDIHTKIAAGNEALKISVVNGEPVDSDDLFVHFSIPPAQAWNNVHEHCSLVLPFKSVDSIHEWCERHRVAFGEAVPLRQVATLANIWYGSHANPDWHKWTVTEAQGIFTKVGLTSDFWFLGEKKGAF